MVALAITWPARYHWYWRLVPVAVIESVTLDPAVVVVSGAGCTVITGATSPPPELLLDEEDELELLDDEELLDEELEDDELLLDELAAKVVKFLAGHWAE